MSLADAESRNLGAAYEKPLQKALDSLEKKNQCRHQRCSVYEIGNIGDFLGGIVAYIANYKIDNPYRPGVSSKVSQGLECLRGLLDIRVIPYALHMIAGGADRMDIFGANENRLEQTARRGICQ